MTFNSPRNPHRPLEQVQVLEKIVNPDSSVSCSHFFAAETL